MDYNVSPTLNSKELVQNSTLYGTKAIRMKSHGTQRKTDQYWSKQKNSGFRTVRDTQVLENMNEDIKLFSERRKVSGEKLLPITLQRTSIDQDSRAKQLDTTKLR